MCYHFSLYIVSFFYSFLLKKTKLKKFNSNCTLPASEQTKRVESVTQSFFQLKSVRVLFYGTMLIVRTSKKRFWAT